MKQLAIFGGNPAFDKYVPIKKPQLGSIIQSETFNERLKDVFTSGMFSGYKGKYTTTFEEEVAKIAGTKYAVAVSSCTSGLILVLKHFIEQSDVKYPTVLVPAFTFSATAHAIKWAGAGVVFVDVDEETCCMDPEQVKEEIELSNVIGVLGVHLYGMPCHVKDLTEVCEEYNIPLIYDAAHALGGKVDTEKIGTFGKANIFSFSPTKSFTAIEGGIVTTDDKELADFVRLMSNYGNEPDYSCKLPGLSARFNELNAIIGLEQLGQNVYDILAKRKKYVEQYKRELEGITGITFQFNPEQYHTTNYDFTIFIDETQFGLKATEVQRILEAENIGTKRYFAPALPDLECYKVENEYAEFPIARKKAEQALSLPIHNYMSEQTINKITGLIRKVFKHSVSIKEKL